MRISNVRLKTKLDPFQQKTFAWVGITFTVLAGIWGAIFSTKLLFGFAIGSTIATIVFACIYIILFLSIIIDEADDDRTIKALKGAFPPLTAFLVILVVASWVIGFCSYALSGLVCGGAIASTAIVAIVATVIAGVLLVD